MCRKGRSTFISLTAVECVRWTHSIKIERNNLLCEQAPTEVFRSIFAWLVTFKLVWCKNPKNNKFRTKEFPNQEFLYGISSFCALSKKRCQSYFQNFFFLPSFGSLFSPSPLSVAFFTAFRESPVSASNCFNSSFASGFSLSGVCTTSVT